MKQPMKKAPLCPKMYQGWGGVGHVGAGWVIVEQMGENNRCYSYLSQMQNDAN